MTYLFKYHSFRAMLVGLHIENHTQKHTRFSLGGEPCAATYAFSFRGIERWISVLIMSARVRFGAEQLKMVHLSIP